MPRDGWKTIELIRGVGQAASQAREQIDNRRLKNKSMELEERQVANQEDKLKAEQDKETTLLEGDQQLANEVVEVSTGAPQVERDAAARIQSLLNNPSPEVRQEGRKAYLELYKAKYIDPLQGNQDNLDKQLQSAFLEQHDAMESGDEARAKAATKEVERLTGAYTKIATLKNRYSADAMKEKKPDQLDIDVLELKMTQGYVPTQAEEEAFIRERYVGKVPGIIPGEMMDKFYKSSTERVRSQYGYPKPKANNVKAGAVPATVPGPTAPAPTSQDIIRNLNTLLKQKAVLPE